MATRVFLAALFMALACIIPPRVLAQNTKHASSDMPTEILRIINEHRAGMGLGPLKMNAVISQAAQKHSHNMAVKKIPFGHDGFGERMEKLRKQIKSTAWAENVADGPTNANDVVDLWLHSPGHRKNIEGNFDLTGIGVVKGIDGDLYYTQIFLKTDN